MKKVKEIYEVVFKSHNIKRDLLYVLWCFSVIPILIIHEGLHIIAILLTFCDAVPERWVFIERESPNVINGFDFPITLLDKSHVKKYIVSSAPLLGYPIAAFLCFWIPIHFIHDKMIGLICVNLLMGYFAWNWETLGLSGADKKTQKYSLKKIRRNFLYWKKSRTFASVYKINHEKESFSHIKRVAGVR